MVKIIEARALLTAKDEASQKLLAMARNVDRISKAHDRVASANVRQTERMSAALNRLQMESGRIDSFRRMSRELNTASLAMRRAEQSAAQAKRALDGVGRTDSAGRLSREYERAARSAERARHAFVEQGRAVRTARQDLEAAGIPVSNLANRQRDLQTRIDQATAAMMRQDRAVSNLKSRPWGEPPRSGSGVPLITQTPATAPAPRFVSHPPGPPPHVPAASRRLDIMEGAAGVAGGISATRILARTAAAGMEIDSERSQARQAGWTDAEINEAEAEANRKASHYGLSPGAAFNLIREARPTFGGDLKTTLDNVGQFFNVHTAMRQKMPQAGDTIINKSINDLVKAGEILGYSSDPSKLVAYADFMTKMTQVHGSALRGEEVLNFAKRAKSAGSDVDFDFLRNVFPTLLPEMGGDGLGVALMTSRQALVGGKMRKRAAENLAELGLINEEDMVKTDDNDVVGVRPQGVVGGDLARKDPLAWVQQHLIPAMDAKRVAPQDRPAIISTLFSDRNTEHLINLITTQQERMRKDRATVEKASGLAGVQRSLVDDPYLVGKRVTGGAQNAAAAISGPFMDPLKVAGGSAAEALNRVAESARKNPEASAAGSVTGAVGGSFLLAGLSAAQGLPWWARWPAVAAGGVMGGLGVGLMAPHLVNRAREPGPLGHVLRNPGWLPSSDVEAIDLRERLTTLDQKIEEMRTRLHPSRRDEPNVEIDRLVGERRDLANRLTQPAKAPVFASGAPSVRFNLPSPATAKPPESSSSWLPDWISKALSRTPPPDRLTPATAADFERKLPDSFKLQGPIDVTGKVEASWPGEPLRFDPSTLTVNPDALRDLRAVVDAPVPVDVSGKLDPVEIKGQAKVDVMVKVTGPAQVTGISQSSSGHVRADAGTAMVGTPGYP